MALHVEFWGVRGSLPSSPTPMRLRQNMIDIMRRFFAEGNTSTEHVDKFFSKMKLSEVAGHGTATTCVEVTSESSQIIIDAGSGIRNLSESLVNNKDLKSKEFHIFLTHFHWDHLLGLPFFVPMFIPGTTMNFYAVQPELEEMIRGKFRKPYFPVPFESLPAKVVFHNLEPRKPKMIGDLSVTPYQLDHPDPCWGFRVTSGGKVYSHCVDTEGIRTTPEALGPDLPLYQGVDLMYFDAQYTLPELVEKANWGHSAAQLGLDIAFRENIKNMVFGHHDPGAVNGHLWDLEKQTKEYFDWRVRSAETNHIVLPRVEWCFAYEGLSFIL